MSLSSIGSYGVIILAALVLYQSSKIRDQNKILALTNEQMSSVTAQMAVLESVNDENRTKLEKLLSTQNNISQHQVKQQHEFKRLKNEVSEIKTWSDVVLPADLARLFQREARTGSGHYITPVPTGNPMPATGSKSENKQ